MMPSRDGARTRRRHPHATASRGGDARRGASSPRRAGSRPSRSPAPRWRLPSTRGPSRSSRRTRGAPAAPTGSTDAGERRPRRSGRWPCPAGSGPARSGPPGSRGDDRAVGDGHLVERLVLVAQTLEDCDGVGQRRLVDLHRLEATLECGVLLEVLAVLVERVAPMVWSSPRARSGFRIEAASIAPSAAPAPTSVWISSMKTMMSPRVRISFVTFFRRSSKSPR